MILPVLAAAAEQGRWQRRSRVISGAGRAGDPDTWGRGQAPPRPAPSEERLRVHRHLRGPPASPSPGAAPTAPASLPGRTPSSRGSGASPPTRAPGAWGGHERFQVGVGTSECHAHLCPVLGLLQPSEPSLTPLCPWSRPLVPGAEVALGSLGLIPVQDGVLAASPEPGTCPHCPGHRELATGRRAGAHPLGSRRFQFPF